MKAFLFNPENDLALAAGNSNYTPPRNACLLSEAGAMLPLWYAGDSDLVLGQCDDMRWLDRVRHDFGITAVPAVSLPESVECSPWGWSEYAVSKFKKAGVVKASLPDGDVLERIRQLSHRRSCMEVYRQLSEKHSYRIEPPVEARSVDEVRRYAARHQSGFYFKAPWSSTGRGVASSESVAFDVLLRRCEGIIGHQGSVMLEPLLDKVADFAMLFKAGSDGRVEWSGFSMFNTSGNAYSGNLLLDDSAIQQRLDSFSVGDDIEMIKSVMPQILTDLLDSMWHGYFGVDMMVYRDRVTGRMMVAPCVEINLRMTMGVVAHVLRRSYLAPDVDNAVFTVDYGQPAQLRKAVVENCRLVSGDLQLVPPGGSFQFLIKIN